MLLKSFVLIVAIWGKLQKMRRNSNRRKTFENSTFTILRDMWAKFEMRDSRFSTEGFWMNTDHTYV